MSSQQEQQQPQPQIVHEVEIVTGTEADIQAITALSLTIDDFEYVSFFSLQFFLSKNNNQ